MQVPFSVSLSTFLIRFTARKIILRACGAVASAAPSPRPQLSLGKYKEREKEKREVDVGEEPRSNAS